MATWHFESRFQKQSISECLRRDKASTEAVIQILAIPPDWQKFKDLYMSDGGIAHLTSMFLWDDPGIESNLILTHPSILVDMNRWRLFQGRRTTTLLVHSYSTGDDTDFGEWILKRQMQMLGESGQSFLSILSKNVQFTFQRRWGINDNFWVQKLYLHPEHF